MRYIGIDLGTSFIKGAILNLETLSVGRVRHVVCPSSLSGLPPLHTEFDPESFVTATRRLIEDLLAEAPDCQGVLMCGQMGGLVLVSPRGEPLSNYVSWLDRRLLGPHPSNRGSFYDVLLARLTPGDWAALGREIRPGTPLSYLFWFAENPEFQPIPGVATLPDFVLARLCGTIPATHPSNAVGAIDLKTRDWHHPLFDRLGFGNVRWPALREINEPAGEARVGGRRLLCYPPVGDHPCALAGALLDFGELSLNISTGSQVSLRSEYAEPGDYQTIPFFDGQFLNRISNLPAGRALAALVRLLSELAEAEGVALTDPWKHIAKAAAAKPASELQANLAFFPTPFGDSGSLTHLREENLTVGDLFRAAFVNMADNYYSSALRLSPAQGWRRLVFSGGLAQKLELLRGLVAEKFQSEYRLCSAMDDTLQGLLVLALVVSGRAASAQAAMEHLRRAQAPILTNKSGAR
jgi:sugar (pentulose or hexulose) kinase